jgi:hypothetical protein
LVTRLDKSREQLQSQLSHAPICLYFALRVVLHHVRRPNKRAAAFPRKSNASAPDPNASAPASVTNVTKSFRSYPETRTDKN